MTNLSSTIVGCVTKISELDKDREILQVLCREIVRTCSKGIVELHRNGQFDIEQVKGKVYTN